MKKYLIIVGGPTASGKTALSIELAQHFNAPIISSDSRQFYKEMCIGNARPNKEELSQAEHFFVADRSVKNLLSAGAFAKEALALLEEKYKENNYVIVVGGSGLFIKAITEGLNSFPKVSPEIRLKVDQLFDEKGLTGLQSALELADPVYFKEVDQNNPARLKRALEVCYSGDHPFSYYRNQVNADQVFIPIYLQTTWPREQLYERINKRVEVMLDQGLEQEARDLLEYKHLGALKTVGYQEWFAHFEGQYDRQRAIELIKQNSRRYAKRQLTWFRRNGYWKHVFQNDLRTALAYIQLVESEGLHLLNEEEGSSNEQGAGSYKVIQTRLGNQQKVSTRAHTILWKNKTDAWLKNWEMSGRTHLAKAVLIHESLHRSECPKVYAFALGDELKTFGFQQVKQDELPSWLKSKVKDETSFWLWNRLEQKF